MRLGEQGAALIKSFEKCVLSAYLPTPKDVPTIGFGHTRAVAMGDTCTQKQADAWFLEDIAWVEDCINGAVDIPLTPNEFDALASLVFNIGCGAFKGSTLLQRINNSDFAGAQQQFARWNKQAGQPLAGLTRRRAEEAKLFEEPPA